MPAIPAELTLLVWSVALCVVQMLVAAMLTHKQVGLLPLVGNHENFPKITGIAGRARRAHWNMLENLALFAVLVLVVQVAGRSNDLTLIGAQLFFWARVAYAVIYVAGIPWARTAVWALSMIGLVMIFLQLL